MKPPKDSGNARDHKHAMKKIEIIVVIAGRPISLEVEAESKEAVLEMLDANGYIDGFCPGDNANGRFFLHGIQAVLTQRAVAPVKPSIIVPAAFAGQRSN